MDQDKKLEEQIKEYQAVAKEHPNVDVGLLAMNALQNQNQNLVSSKGKRWAYLVSIALPPLGLLFAFRYFFGDEDDARQVAWICVILTAIGLVLIWVGTKALFSGSGASLEQIQQIKPSDAMQLLQ